MSNPFDVVTAISKTKKNVLDEQLSNYIPFIINKAFSNFSDTILYANQMNQMHFLDKQLQHDYLFYSIRPRHRYSKWNSKKKDETILAIQKFFECNNQRAKQYISILTEEQIKVIVKTVSELQL